MQDVKKIVLMMWVAVVDDVGVVIKKRLILGGNINLTNRVLDRIQVTIYIKIITIKN